ncbi:MAG: FAD-dependent oxidoreductase [Burkholderiales bacterium]|nr:Sulfide-quinone reductase [Rhodocyclaceae bacterium]MCQ3922887.1 NAD(P)/FAD-dependent oxidoreductase [Rhodocyclaceae bacterium]MCZ2420045.1 FAD-dependent oxidoreductase [Burkholderiales bacterium]HNQ56034.1 FAD-dependent oxidoreductase [Candidatus Desulfobacillus denitrificans]HNT61691.1 FAD-dependent oxidoreductase [Candidatus Desulfobacillus denitrificans]
MNRISIIGTGFAALSAARRLRQLDRQVDITVIGPRPELIFLPSLIWLPSGKRRAEDLRIPLQNFFTRQRIAFHAGEATGLENGGRTVLTTAGPVDNDGLVIACGGRFIKKLPGIEHAITPCEGIAAVERLRDAVQAMERGSIALGFAGNPNEPVAMRGGPIFEFLFGLDTQLRREGRRERIALTFFNPMPKPGNRLGEKAVERLLGEMRRRDIATHLGHKLAGFEPGRVKTEGGDFVADIIVFMPGLTGNAWFDNTDLPRSPGGLIRADAQCRVEGRERTYVAGDAGSFPGPDWMPKQAHMADLQAETAAENLLVELAGGKPEKTFKVELLCIVDSLDAGMLVKRTPEGGLALPPLGLMHHAKAFFESWYLRRYR